MSPNVLCCLLIFFYFWAFSRIKFYNIFSRPISCLLPDGITIKNIGEISSRRNEVIADMFARMDVVEKAGTGIFRIREAMDNEGLRPPVFENIDEFFKIILYRPLGVKEASEKSTQKKYLGK